MTLFRPWCCRWPSNWSIPRATTTMSDSWRKPWPTRVSIRADLVRGRFDHDIVVTKRLLRSLLSDLPPTIVEQRVHLAATRMVYALTEQEWHRARTEISTGDFWLFADNLVDSITGMLMVPVSNTTRGRLRNAINYPPE